MATPTDPENPLRWGRCAICGGDPTQCPHVNLEPPVPTSAPILCHFDWHYLPPELRETPRCPMCKGDHLIQRGEAHP